MVTIGVDQSLSDCEIIYEHRCLENINKPYKTAIQCDYKQQYKAILKQQWYPLLRVLLKIVQCHLANMWL